MPETFLGFQVAGATKHFLITFADAGDADEILRANAILESCEADLATLEQWFSCDYDQAPYGIWVQVLKGSPGAGADNYGYSSSESPLIQISGTDPLQGQFVMAGAVAQMLFVAELAEVLMGFTSYGWQAGNSAGEGLSRVAAAELHAAGYYANNYGPFVNGWLGSTPRPDWVASTEGTDQDAISFGCAIVFLYYLRYELGYSWAQIVAAGGATLADTYAALTGDPASGAFHDLTELLSLHLPPGDAFRVPRDNFFPLYATPVVACAVNEFTVGSPQLVSVTSFEAAVCHRPPAEYSYQTFDLVTEIDVTANAYGLIDGTFQWSVNGVPLAAPPALGTTSSELTVSVPIVITDVAPPVSGNNPPPFTAVTDLVYFLTSASPTKSQLFLRNTTSPGNGELTITVSVSEAAGPAGQPSGTAAETWTLTTLTYELSASYWAAMWPCLSHPVSEASAALTALGSLVPVLNAPDPSPVEVAGLAAAAQTYLGALTEISARSAGQRTQAASIIAANAQRTVGPAVRAGIDGGQPIVAPPGPALTPARGQAGSPG